MHLLLNTEGVDRMAGVRRVLNPPAKQPDLVLAPEMPWEQGGVSGLMALLYDRQEAKFKMWYRARIDLAAPVSGDRTQESSERATRRERVFLCYAESADGVCWTRPPLGRFDYEGSRANNIVREIDFADSVFFNIVKDPDDPDPSRRYKALGFAHDVACSNLRGVTLPETGVCVAFSPDGLHWPEPPLLVMTTHNLTDADCVLPHREPSTGKWVAFFRPRTHPKRRFIGYAESDDFVRWTYLRMALTPDGGDDEWTEFYGLAATATQGVRIGALWVMHNNPAHSPMTNELVYSLDGQRYHRAFPGRQWLALGPDGAVDSRRVWPVALLEQGDELWVYYNAGNKEHGSDRGMAMQSHLQPEGGAARGGVGLARVPLGHYAGLHADVDGLVESKWWCNYGDAGVQALAQVMPGGAVLAEVLDQYGNVMPGYERSRCRTEPVAAGRYRFTWDGKTQVTDESGRVGHVVKLRFHLYRATLYGFQVGDDRALPAYE